MALSLLKAQVDTVHTGDPSKYLTQLLDQVYTNRDPRTYPLSSYSYMIVPTAIQGQFTQTKGQTLAAFAYFAMCQGQQTSASLGYAPMPINLVQAAFDQLRKIPGAVLQNITVQNCTNPTFAPDGTDQLVASVPYPPACDKRGPTQCGSSPPPVVPEGRPIMLLGGAVLAASAWVLHRRRRQRRAAPVLAS